MKCHKCTNQTVYQGSTRDGDTVTDYFICIKGHKRKINVRYFAEIEKTVKWLEQPPF